MFVVIYEPPSGIVLYSRQLQHDELLDERSFADYIAAAYDRQISNAKGYIPNCGGDIRVEFREDPNDGTVIRSEESFYFKDLDE